MAIQTQSITHIAPLAEGLNRHQRGRIGLTKGKRQDKRLSNQLEAMGVSYNREGCCVIGTNYTGGRVSVVVVFDKFSFSPRHLVSVRELKENGEKQCTSNSFTN